MMDCSYSHNYYVQYVASTFVGTSVGALHNMYICYVLPISLVHQCVKCVYFHKFTNRPS